MKCEFRDLLHRLLQLQLALCPVEEASLQPLWSACCRASQGSFSLGNAEELYVPSRFAM